ncbi:MAG TPA: hypothetical protein VMY99_00655 [Nevskiaceae bacterium]|nr:hypothetical protein [Nevskiaceae bacterium]
MQTITAKELRTNLDKVVARIRAGERIRVTYRSKPAFTLEPEPTDTNEPEPGSPEAIKRFVASTEDLRKQIKKHRLAPTSLSKSSTTKCSTMTPNISSHTFDEQFCRRQHSA